MSDKLKLFDLTNAIRRDVVEGIAKAYELGYADGFAKGFAEGGIAGREQVAQWMIARSYATGHGDTVEDLLVELEGQARTRGDRVAAFGDALSAIGRTMESVPLRREDEP